MHWSFASPLLGSAMNAYQPMGLGIAAAACAGFAVGCLECGHRVEPDPAEIGERHARLVCSRCGSRRPYVSLIGPDRLDADDLRRASVGGLQSAAATLLKEERSAQCPTASHFDPERMR